MHVTHSVMACLPGLRSSFVTVDESEKDRDKTALGEGTWEEVRAVQQTNTTVNKWSELYKKKLITWLVYMLALNHGMFLKAIHNRRNYNYTQTYTHTHTHKTKLTCNPCSRLALLSTTNLNQEAMSFTPNSGTPAITDRCLSHTCSSDSPAWSRGNRLQ